MSFADDIDDGDLKLRPTRKLKPEDFQAQLYMSCDNNGVEITDRELVFYGQDSVDLLVTRDGFLETAAIYDRQCGGEAVLICDINTGRGLSVCVCDTIHLINMQWP